MTHFWTLALRRIALLEGASFILLLFVAMPLKYYAGMPMAVRIVGMTHGLLLIALCLVLFQVMQKTQWPFKRCALVFLASLLPFGPFLLDSKMKAWSTSES